MPKSFYEKSSVIPLRLDNKTIEYLFMKYGIDYDDHREICYENKELYALGKILSKEIMRILK